MTTLVTPLSDTGIDATPAPAVGCGTGDRADAFLPSYLPAAQAIVNSVSNSAAPADAAAPGGV